MAYARGGGSQSMRDLADGPRSPLKTDNGLLAGAGHLSSRAHRSVVPVYSFINDFLLALRNQWSPTNPDGNLIVCVAENKISSDLILAKLNETDEVDGAHGEVGLGYDNMAGTERLRKAAARMMDSTFLKGAPVDAANVVVQAGSAAILQHLAFLLCNEGDAILIPAPYYPAFDNDLQVMAGVQALPVFCDKDKGYLPSIEDLEQARAGAIACGVRVRGVLLTNPNNPTGVIYPKQTMLDIIEWALPEGIHVISDEIYANSIFGPSLAKRPAGAAAAGDAAGGGAGTEFWSAGRLLTRGGARAEGLRQSQVDDFVHVVYGMSKDWCMSGYRVGFLYTANKRLASAFGNLGCFSAVSNRTQETIASMLEDPLFVEEYLAENRARLAKSYSVLTSELDKGGVSHTAAEGAMFCWVDLRELLPEGATWKDEWELFRQFVDKDRLLMSPGQPCHAPQPGYFRMCWAFVPPEGLQVAARRIAARVADARRRAATDRSLALSSGSSRYTPLLGLVPVGAALLIGAVVVPYLKRS